MEERERNNTAPTALYMHTPANKQHCILHRQRLTAIHIFADKSTIIYTERRGTCRCRHRAAQLCTVAKGVKPRGP